MCLETQIKCLQNPAVRSLYHNYTSLSSNTPFPLLHAPFVVYPFLVFFSSSLCAHSLNVGVPMAHPWLSGLLISYANDSQMLSLFEPMPKSTCLLGASSLSSTVTANSTYPKLNPSSPNLSQCPSPLPLVPFPLILLSQ